MGNRTLLIDQDGDFWMPGELERIVTCPGCRGTKFVYRYDGLDDLLEQVPGQWSIASCCECASLVLDPRPTRHAIGKAYTPTYCTHASAGESHKQDNGHSLLWRLANGYLNNRYGCSRRPSLEAGRWILPMLWPLRQQLDYFYRHLPRQQGRLLDVGCGNGTFLLRARDAGWEVEGLEPDPVAAQNAVAAGLRIHAVLPQSFQPEKPFNRITLSHVFEHVHDPADLLGRCFEMLETDGEIWLSMPNIKGIGHLLFGRNWFALDPPRHLFLPTPQVLRKMLNNAGFTDVSMRRRGRGAKTTLNPSNQYAEVRGGRRRLVTGWSWIIDIAASLIPAAAEELVVSARKA